MPTSVCPDCQEEVYVDPDCEQGDVIECDECGSSLEVVGLDPVELDLRREEDDYDEDRDYDNFDYDDDSY
jgi:alpha-aminoadipate carrier protein LysW